jgi:hypothetical protein
LIAEGIASACSNVARGKGQRTRCFLSPAFLAVGVVRKTVMAGLLSFLMMPLSDASMAIHARFRGIVFGELRSRSVTLVDEVD